MPNEILVPIVASVVPIIFAVIAVTMILVSVFNRARQQRTQQEYAEKYRAKTQEMQSSKPNAGASRSTSTTERPTRPSVYDKHQQDAHEHEHLGEEEHYDEIVGSLGEVNDEGCEDLSGVRFIAHDIAYEVSDDNADYTRVAQAMVLGDILNNPRFKKPYSRK